MRQLEDCKKKSRETIMSNYNRTARPILGGWSGGGISLLSSLSLSLSLSLSSIFDSTKKRGSPIHSLYCH